MNRKGLLRAVAAAVVLTVSCVGGYFYFYDAPMRGLEGQLKGQQGRIARFESELRGRNQVQEGLKQAGATTLGASADQVDSRFRSGLRAAVQACGISDGDIVVSTISRPADRTNPAGSARGGFEPSGLKTALRRQRDFAVVQAKVEAKGTLEQVLRAATVIQAQAWVHRVGSFSLRPEGKERTRFVLELGVETLLLPEFAPRDAAEPQITLVEEGGRMAWASIVDKNIFREPAPVAAAPTTTPNTPRSAPPPPPPPPPYDDWRLTGVIESRLGVEAIMVNVKSQERLTVPAGSVVAEAKLLAAAGERAVFEIRGEQFEVTTGQTLAQRRPAGR